ncbi:MAG: hypothetical protein DSY89_03560 [Deltaproteobacteria bacterium]|nr:MAG: hypothetical protein DSY89_03560 [Deltaproteobacteria bacterium]
MQQTNINRLSKPHSFEVQIELSEHETQEKYNTAINTMQTLTLSNGFNQLLAFRIIPALMRIGFDEQICWTLFKRTAPVWRKIGPVETGVELCYPVLMKTINEIRQGILADSKKNSTARFVLDNIDASTKYALINQAMHPEKLAEEFDDMSLSWIVLPRAYDLLEKEHSRYMLIYIEFLDNETESEFVKILARIIIEFVGNYSLKYIDNFQLKKHMVNALFYGYATMFWKNLVTPPPGLEDSLIFDSYLRLARMIHDRFASSNRDMAETIEKMEREKEKIFPAYNIFGLAYRRHADVNRFFVALCHGMPGVESVVRFFGIGGPLLKDKTDGRLPYVAVPVTLSALFRLIRKRYRFETPKTRQSIREFLFQLGSNYHPDHIRMVFSGSEPPKVLRFVGPRVFKMVQDLATFIQRTPHGQ